MGYSEYRVDHSSLGALVLALVTALISMLVREGAPLTHGLQGAVAASPPNSAASSTTPAPTGSVGTRIPQPSADPSGNAPTAGAGPAPQPRPRTFIIMLATADPSAVQEIRQRQHSDPDDDLHGLGPALPPESCP